MNQSPKTSQRCCWMKPDPVVHLVCVMMLSRCSACHQGTALKWGKHRERKLWQRYEERPWGAAALTLLYCRNLKSCYCAIPPPCGCLCNVSRIVQSKNSLTCFAIVAVEVLRKVQTSNLLLKKLNTCGIYFSRSCWNTRNLLFFFTFLSYFNFLDLSGD